MSDVTDRGRSALSEKLNPGAETALAERSGQMVPGMAESLVDFACGRQSGREGLPLRERCSATIAGLTAPCGQTALQLKANITSDRKAGLGQRKTGAVIRRMSQCGGMPAIIKGANAALDAFAKEEG